MRVAFDTNVILDAIEGRADFESARKLTDAVATDAVEGILSANAITDIYFIAKKHIGTNAAKEAIQVLLDLFDIADVSGDVCGEALYLPMKDFEDAVMAVCASRMQADYIVTRDEELLSETGCPVSAISPYALAEKLNL